MKNNATPTKALRGLDFLSVFFATVFFLSYIPAKLIFHLQLKFKGERLEDRKWTGAGMVGTIAGALTYLLFPEKWTHSILMLLLALAFSVVISGRAEKAMNSHDDSRIVIDEWVGALFALFAMPQEIHFPFFTALILFRVFDVFKGPWGQWLQRLPGGFGVTMDDIGAGIIANGLTRILVFSFTKFAH